MARWNKPISKYKKLKIIFSFCLDLTAIQTALLLGLNRKTINKYFNIFRQKIYNHQLSQMKNSLEKLRLMNHILVPGVLKEDQLKEDEELIDNRCLASMRDKVECILK